MGFCELSPKCGLVVLIASAVLNITVATPPPLEGKFEQKNILVTLPLETPSHYRLFTALTDELLERGHNVTFVASRPLPKKHPRQREILVDNTFGQEYKYFNQKVFARNTYVFETMILMYTRGIKQSRSVLQDPQVHALKNESFDLVISEVFFALEPTLALAHHFGCPSMAINPIAYHMVLNKATGGSINPSYVPCMFGLARKIDSFLDSLYNTLNFIFALLLHHFYYMPKADALVHEFFPDAPPLYDLVNNISLTLSNSKPAFSYPVPLPPSVLPVGGMHIKPGEPLPDELRKWIEDSKHGVIYFSLGSNLKAGILPEDKKSAIILSFGKLKQRVLLKWTGEPVENAPANCRFEQWVPQLAILAHPNVVLFVTHGGIMSAQEAAYFGVPVVGVPVFGDQFSNLQIAKEKGIALYLPIHSLTEEAFDHALDEVINNPKYRDSAKKLSIIFRSDPMTSLESAVYYTELLMKLGSLKHLQPVSLHLKWYEYLLLDVMAVLAVGIFIIYIIIRYLFKSVVNLWFKQKVKTA